MPKPTSSKPGTPSPGKGGTRAGTAASEAPPASPTPSPAAANPTPSPAAKTAAAKPSKGKGKGKEKQAAQPPPPVPFEEHQRLLAEQSSNFAQLQSQLDTLRASTSQYASESNSKIEELTKQLQTREEIIAHLELKTTSQSDRIAELKREAEKARIDASNVLSTGRTQLIEDEKKIRGEMEEYMGKMKGMQERLDELEEWGMRKEGMEKEMQGLKRLLEEKEKEYREGLREVEVKSLRDKSFIKKQAMDLVNDAISAFKDVAEQQLSESTKHAMRENQMLDSQLRLLSNKMTKILPINDKLRQKTRLLRTELALSGERERILAGRIKAREETIRLLVEKLKECDGLLLKMVEEVEKLPPSVLPPLADSPKRRDSTGRRGSIGGAPVLNLLPEPSSTATPQEPRPVSPQQKQQEQPATQSSFTPAVTIQRDQLSRTLASVMNYASDETPIPAPSFGMGTLAEEQDEESEEFWETPAAASQGRAKREMSMTVVGSLAEQFRGKLEGLTGSLGGPAVPEAAQ